MTKGNTMTDYDDLLCQAKIEIQYNYNQFIKWWNAEFRTHLGLPESFSIENYWEVEGGFCIDKDSYAKLPDDLHCFFDSRMFLRQDKVYFRGYTYYECDPTVHRRFRLNNQEDLLRRFQNKWNKYPHQLTFKYLNNQQIPFESWVGTLSFLEYLFTDLATIRWFLFIGETEIKENCFCDYQMICDDTDWCIEQISMAMILLLMFDHKSAYDIIYSSYERIISSESIIMLLKTQYDLSVSVKPMVRSIREGDSVVKIYATYRQKLAPFLAENSYKKVLLLSNAFGAINSGCLLKKCVEIMNKTSDETIIIDTENINYSQHRYYHDQFGYASSKVRMFSDYYSVENYDCVIILDDTVWTAGTYWKICHALNSENLYLLPYSLDCNSLIYSKQVSHKDSDMFSFAQEVHRLAREVGGMLPAFLSSWDRLSATASHQVHTDDSSYDSVMNGDDTLMKYLWGLYYTDYIRKE